MKVEKHKLQGKKEKRKIWNQKRKENKNREKSADLMRSDYQPVQGNHGQIFPGEETSKSCHIQPTCLSTRAN